MGTHPISEGKWFKMTMRMTLGKDSAGLTQVYVDDELDSEVVGTTLMPDGLEVMDHHNSFQVGLTCNTSMTFLIRRLLDPG